MKKILAVLSVFLCVHLWFAPALAFGPNEKAYKWADKQLKKMSVDEKIGQIVQIGINARYLNQDSYEFKELRRQIVENKLGGIVLFGAPIYESVQLVNRMQEAAA